MNNQPIGIFDSGVGGLSVYDAIQHTLPGEDVVYIADQKHVPYGLRTLEEVMAYSTAITKFLFEKNYVVFIVVFTVTALLAFAAFRYRDAVYRWIEKLNGKTDGGR